MPHSRLIVLLLIILTYSCKTSQVKLIAKNNLDLENKIDFLEKRRGDYYNPVQIDIELLMLFYQNNEYAKARYYIGLIKEELKKPWLEQLNYYKFNYYAGKTYLSFARIQDAISHFRAALKLRPRDPDLLSIELIELLIGEDEREEVQLLFNDLWNKKPNVFSAELLLSYAENSIYVKDNEQSLYISDVYQEYFGTSSPLIDLQIDAYTNMNRPLYALLMRLKKIDFLRSDKIILTDEELRTSTRLARNIAVSSLDEQQIALINAFESYLRGSWQLASDLMADYQIDNPYFSYLYLVSRIYNKQVKYDETTYKSFAQRFSNMAIYKLHELELKSK